MTLANFSSGAFSFVSFVSWSKEKKLLSLDFSADVEDFTAKFNKLTFVFNVGRNTERRKSCRLQSFLFYFRFSVADKHWNLKISNNFIGVQ